MTDQEKFSEEYRKYRESYGVINPIALDEIEEAYYQGMLKQKDINWVDVKNRLPDFDREVVALQKLSGTFRVVFAHRPDPRGYVMIDGKKCYAKTYGKGHWNLKDIIWWLDLELPIKP